MLFYIATSLARAGDHNRVRDALVSRGHEITYDWTHHGSVRGSRERISVVAVSEFNGILNADTAIVLLPGGRGTHTELGIALASKKRVIVHSLVPNLHFEPGEDTSAFYHHPSIVQCHGDMVDSVLEALARTERVGANRPEPPPREADGPAVWDLVVADMQNRDRAGEAKYGARLRPHNGRNALIDAYQECLDLAVYLRQEIAERKALEENMDPIGALDFYLGRSY